MPNKPVINIVSAGRCDAQGNLTPSGAYRLYLVTASVDPAEGARPPFFQVVEKTFGTTTSTYTEIIHGADTSVESYKFVTQYESDDARSIVVEAMDGRTTAKSCTIWILPRSPMVQIDRLGASIHIPVDMNGKTLSGLSDPVDASDASTKAYADAVGSLSRKIDINTETGSNVDVSSGSFTTVYSLNLEEGYVYVVYAVASFANNGTGRRAFLSSFNENGSAASATARIVRGPALAGAATTLGFTSVYPGGSRQFFNVWQNSGSNLNCSVSVSWIRFKIQGGTE